MATAEYVEAMDRNARGIKILHESLDSNKELTERPPRQIYRGRTTTISCQSYIRTMEKCQKQKKRKEGLRTTSILESPPLFLANFRNVVWSYY